MIFYDYPFFCKRIVPTSAAIRDPVMTASLAVLVWTSLLKERVVIKIDIVNPIPATRPRPVIIFQVTPPGNGLSLPFTSNQEENTIPIGFPRKRPRMIPKEREEKRFPANPKVTGMAVFSSANTGRII
jgi:hypothetical protein